MKRRQPKVLAGMNRRRKLSAPWAQVLHVASNLCHFTQLFDREQQRDGQHEKTHVRSMRKISVVVHVRGVACRRNCFCSLNMQICNGNRTEWSPIRSVIIGVITKSDDRAVGVRFVYQEYDYWPNFREKKNKPSYVTTGKFTLKNWRRLH